MSLSGAELLALLGQWLWPLVRISAFVVSAPVLGSRSIPRRIRLALALVLTVAVVPVIAPGASPGAGAGGGEGGGLPPLDPFSGPGLLLTGEQVLVGLALGFSLRLLFVVLELAGQYIAHLMGLGFASLIDPANGLDVPVLSQLYIIMATLVYLALDGHLHMVLLLVESFRVLPVAGGGLELGALWQVSGAAGWVFAAGLQVALPVVTALLVANIAFGVVSRAAPQLHVVVIGLPITLLLGFLFIWLTADLSVQALPPLIEESFGRTRALTGALAPAP